MADSTTNYVVAVTDSIAPSLQPKLQAIGGAALSASSGVAALQQSLNKLNANSITSIAAGIRSASSAQTQLSTSTSRFNTVGAAAVGVAAQLAGSFVTLTQTAGAAAAQVGNLAAAVQAYAAGAQSAVAAANAVATANTRVNNASSGAAGGIRGMTAALGVARGNITSANRLAASFLSTLVGSGPIMAAAFSVLGAVALVAVLAQVAQAVFHVVQAYKDMQLASRQASDQAILDGEKVLRVKGSLFSASTAASFFNGSDIIPKDVTVQNAAEAIKTASAEQQVAAARRAANEAGLQGTALQAQRVKDLKEEQAETIKLRDAFNARTQAYKAQLEGTHAVVESGGGGDFATGGEFVTKQVLNITDTKQVTAIQAQMKTAADEAKRLNTEIDVIGYRIQGAGKKEAVASLKDEAKAAREEMVRLNGEFHTYELNLGHKITPQEGLDFWQSKEAHLKHYSDNIDNVVAKEVPYQQKIEAGNSTVKSKNESLDSQIADIGAYSNALKIQQQYEKEIQALQRADIELTQLDKNVLKEKITTIVEAATYQKELNAEYSAANGPLDVYTAKQQALSKLMQDDPAHVAEYSAQLSVATRQYQDATIPLNEYNRSLKEQMDLMAVYGPSASIEQQVMSVENQLRSQGRSLTEAQTNALREQLTVMQSLRTVQSDVNRLYSESRGAQEALTAERLADTKALAAHIIDLGTYNEHLYQSSLRMIELQNLNGNGTWSTRALESIAGLAKGYTNFAEGAQKTMNGFYQTLTTGFADTVGHIIAYGGNLGNALLDVARQAVGGLISAFVKLGVQWLVTAALGQTLSAAATAGSVAEGTAAAAAWAPAAAFVSLATMGANAGPADVALVTTTGLADLLSVAKFAGGGYVNGPGTSTSDSIPARLSAGEYVVNAKATQENYHILDAINRGGKLMQFASGGFVAGNQMATQSSGISYGGQTLVIEDHTSGVKFVPVGATHDEVRIIARDVVQTDAPGTVASTISNPNSHMSKALRTHTKGGVRNRTSN